MTTIGEVREAIDAIPVELLTDDDLRVLDETTSSLDALESFDVVPTVICFVGSSGSGKSSFVNAALGVDASPVGPVRPTTDTLVMVGSSGPVSLASSSEYLHVSSIRPGLLVIDTPAWEWDPDAVASAVAVADLVVVVVTPSRYADAAVAELAESLDVDRPAAVVLNRVAVDPSDRAVLVSSVRERFGVEPIVVDEGEALEAPAGRLVDQLDIDAVVYRRSDVLRSAIASGARYLARRTAEAAPAVGALRHGVETADAPTFGVDRVDVAGSWSDAKEMFAAEVSRICDRVDGSVVSASQILGERCRARLPDVGRDLDDGLDRWREATTSAFLADARIRWRRTSAEKLIDDVAWRVGLDPTVATSRRFRRLLGDRLARRARMTNQSAISLGQDEVDQRLEQWRTVAARLGDHAPGVLLAEAEAFRPPRGTDD